MTIVIGFSYFLFKSELVDISYPIFILTLTFLTGLYFRFLEENKIALSNLQKEAKLLKERELAGGVQKVFFQILKDLKILFMQKMFLLEMFLEIILML